MQFKRGNGIIMLIMVTSMYIFIKLINEVIPGLVISCTIGANASKLRAHTVKEP